ncbi:MAG TPA: IS1595 family transposase [Sphingomicrobium sp.]|nr:IS1595 family transposase [Sphingomicrobium sp.]
MKNEPRTLIEAVRYFGDPDVSLKHMIELRWPNGVQCPNCGRKDVNFIATRRLWECKGTHARKQFSAKVGTIFEDSAVSLDKWFVAIWQVANCKNGISSYELGRSIGVTQKTAWHMNHRIRLAMKLGTIEKMSGEVESDETFVGGLTKNMHPRRRVKVQATVGGSGKSVVLGILQRSRGENPSRILAGVVPHARRPLLHFAIRSNVERGSTVYTDAWPAYRGMTDYVHAVIDHGVQYVNGRIHTNGVENFWSLLKRSIKGTYISVEPFHLGRYVDEQVFRFNEREGSDADRFNALLRRVTGKRLTYQELTNGTLAATAA